MALFYVSDCRASLSPFSDRVSERFGWEERVGGLPSLFSFLELVKALFKVADQVVNAFQADREADQTVGNAHRFSFFLGSAATFMAFWEKPDKRHRPSSLSTLGMVSVLPHTLQLQEPIIPTSKTSSSYSFYIVFYRNTNNLSRLLNQNVNFFDFYFT